VQAKVREIEVNVKDFGAAVDGSTDDGAAWDTAVDAVEAAGGGVVCMPEGTSITNRQIVLPTKVRIKGKGKRASILKAGGSFSTSTAVVRLGSGAASGYVFDCRVEDMTIDCNTVSGSIGIYSTDANEGSGARDVLVNKYMAFGVELDDSGASNFNDHYLFDECELYADATATGTVGFHYKGLKNGGQVRRLTVSANSGAADQTTKQPESRSRVPAPVVPMSRYSVSTVSGSMMRCF
jgi:hypothetical protein